MMIQRFRLIKDNGVLPCFICSLFLLASVAACSGKQQTPQKPPVPVTAVTAVQKTVPVQLSAIGNVEAYSTVSMKSQIGGVLTRVHFREGQEVNKGDLLFTIDPRPYEAALKQAEANLAKNIAQLEHARVEVRRYEELARKGYVAQEQYDQIRTNEASLGAMVNADKALVENAQLQLQYCSIHSPVTGKTGNLMANQGNLIKANADNAMVTINQIQPIYVSFSVPEQYVGEIKKYMSSGKLKVDVVIGKDEKYPEAGVVTFVDNTVDAATGTIKLKATFMNNKKQLWPGQFVHVTMTLTARPDAIVVPSQAIQTGQKGPFVFAIKPDLTVESRSVVIGLTFEYETVVEKGLQAGERVVTDGHMRLFPGATVAIKTPLTPGEHKQ
jgi:multidrug efflux system membrane fusion protein